MSTNLPFNSSSHARSNDIRRVVVSAKSGHWLSAGVYKCATDMAHSAACSDVRVSPGDLGADVGGEAASGTH